MNLYYIIQKNQKKINYLYNQQLVQYQLNSKMIYKNNYEANVFAVLNKKIINRTN